LGQQGQAGQTEEAQTAAGAVNFSSSARLKGSRAIFPPQFHLGGHYGWSIEVTFENSKQLLGLEDPANRTPLAVERTAPLALLLYSLLLTWFDRVGYLFVRFPDRPWYRHKREPSFADLLTTLRRLSWQEQFEGVCRASAPFNKCLEQLIEAASRAG
jgi:hypothetical protein